MKKYINRDAKMNDILEDPHQALGAVPFHPGLEAVT